MLICMFPLSNRYGGTNMLDERVQVSAPLGVWAYWSNIVKVKCEVHIVQKTFTQASQLDQPSSGWHCVFFIITIRA